MIVLRKGAATVELTPGFIAPDVADSLLGWSLARIPWASEVFSIYGRKVTARRQSCAFGDAGLVYRYARQVRAAQPIPEPLKRFLVAPFNFALANLYPDGRAGIGAHADDEPDLDPSAPIATVSLGAVRTMVFSDRGGEVGRVVLPHGSYLVMSSEVQRTLKHAIIPDRSTGARVSLTLRRVLRPAN